MQKTLKLFANPLILLSFFSFTLGAANAGLPVTEGFSDQNLLDISNSSADWLTASGVGQLPQGYPILPNITLPTEVAETIGTETNWTPGVAWGDVDKDGDIDLIFVNSGQANNLYLNDGSNTFTTSATSIATDSVSSTSAALVDVDNDTDLDLVIGNYDETNKLYYNDGTGNFDATGTLIGEHNGSWIWGDNPTEKIIAADVNKDGYIDILTANNGITGNYGTVNRIFFNDGTGSFPSNTDIDSESDNSSSIVAADFDNDGHLDLAVANYWPAPADRIYLNNGDATFSSAINLSSSDTDTYDFAVGDIDADGDLDLISASIGENQIYLNDGSANFTLLGSVSSDAVYSQSISLHDLDMDGDLDLIIGNSNTTNQYFLNDGTGNFSAAVQLGSESLATHELVAVDIDKDGDLDFIAANTSGDGNRLYRNHSAGGWVKAGTDVGTESNISTSVAVADIDGDFIPDLIIGKSGTANLVYFNDGLGGFSSSGTSIGSETDDTQDVVIADVDHDGFDDLVVANNLTTNKYYLNDGTGNFSATGTDIGSETDATQAVLVKDLNADGLVDVISIESNDTTKIYWNSGGAVFSSTGESFSTDADDSQAAILFDVDSDGELDLVVINNGLDKIYLNSGQGVFASTGTQLSNDAYNGRAVDYGDIDNDGDLDLVIANDSAADLYYLNDGSGNFSTNGGSLGSEADTSEDIKLVDFDADGDLDVIVAKSTGNLIYYNQGDATFSDSVSLDTDSSDTAALAYADFDLSGSIDIIAANSSSISKLYFNNSIGGYSSESAEISSATNNSLDAQFADFDRDGWLDLVVANDEQAMLIYFNDGFGNLSATGVDIGASTEKPQEMRIGDLDLDGDMDIVTANYNQVNKMYLNDGTGSFTAVDIGSEIEVTWGIGLADFNQDGYLDIVVSTGSGSTNKIYLNNGDGSYPASGTDISSDTFGDGVAIADVNQDGKLDILITGSQTYLYLGNGDGSFQSSSVIGASNSSAASVSFADLNNDTYPDMVIGYGFSGDLTNRLYLNDGTGNFPSSGTALGAHLDQTRDLDLLDIDKDGDLDIVFSNVGQTNKLHLNDGQGNFDTGSDLSSEIYDTWAIEFADVNLDGYLELVTLNAAQTNRINTINRFSPASSQISSITLNSSITDIPRAILTASETLSDHTGVEYLLSNDAGVNWYPVTSGVAFDFPNGIDGDLKWRAKLSSRSARYTPVINQLVVDFQNTEPEITSIEETTASEGVEYSYTFTATDIDVADSLTLSAPILPSWLSFVSATGVLSGTPDFSHAGSHSVTLQVSDGTDDVSQSFTIEVNVYPVITTLEETTAFEDLSYSYTIAATDSNGDSLTYSASTLPSWLSFDSGSTTLTGTPTNNEVGDHSVVLSVSDGALSVDQSFTVTVFNVNDSPVITSTEITSATEDTAYAYTFSASDDDASDNLTYSAPTLPTWLSFDSATGILSGTPTNNEVSSHSVTLRVNDGTVDVDQSFSISVANTNDAPVITSTEITSATEDAAYSYTFTASDVDVSDTLTLSAPTLPSWLSFDENSGILSGTPTNAEVGSHSVLLRVNDGTIDVDQSFSITVANINDAPVITSSEITSATEDAAYSYTFTASDVDVSDSLTLSAPTLPSWLSFDSSTGVLSGTPTNAEVGSHSVLLRVNDGTIDVEQSFSITVANINDAPVIISNGISSATEDLAYSYTFTASDVDVSDALILSAPTLPSWLNFDSSTGVLSGTPTNTEVGSHSVLLRVNDGTVDVDQRFSITVANTNDAPVITSSEITSASEDAAYSYTFSASDVDVSDTLTLSAPTLPFWLSFDTSTGVLSGTPTNTEVGSHSVLLRVNDGTVDVDQSFSITVANTNDSPVITSSEITSAAEDTAYAYTFSASDDDASDSLTYSAPTLPTWLSFDSATGILSGTPTNDEVGSHSVTLRVNDGAVDVDQSFSISVSNTNDSPVITSTEITSATEDTAYAYTFSASDDDVSDSLTYSAPTLPTWLSFDSATGILSGTPTNAEVGSHSVLLRVNDGTVDVDQSFTIFVSDPNSPIVLALLPAADSIDLATQGEFFDLILNEDIQITQFNDTLIQVFEVQSQALIEKLDTDQVGILGNSLSFVLSATLTPNVEYEILVSANVIEDLSGNPFAGVTENQWRFTTINNLTVATDDNVQTNEDTSIQIDVLANDFDSDNLIVPSSTLVLDAPSFGLAQVNAANGVITYTPNANFNGQDSFTYQVSDTQAESSNIAVVTIDVTAVNDAPNLQADVVQTTEDRMLAIDVLANDTDIDLGDSLDPNSIQIVQNPSHGSLNIVGSLIEYSPAQDFTGGDSFSYQAADSQGRFGTPVNVMINVLGENDIPVAIDDVAQTTEDTSINIAVLANDFDIEDVAIQAANITLVKPANLASLTINLDGTINYQPLLNANGNDSFEYVVTDSEGAISAPAVVNVVISAVADSPVTNHDTVILAEDSSQLINVLGNDTDVENNIDFTSITITSGADSGALSIEENGLVMYQPAADFFGSDSFSYSVMDDTGLVSNISVVSIQVTAVNDQPIANADHYQTLEDTEILLNPADNDQDIDGQLDLTSLVIVSQPSLGVVTIQSNGQIRYQPNFNVFGTDSFSYQISDDQGLVSEIANVTIDITAVNDAPVFTSQAVSLVNEDELYSYLIQLADIEQDILTLNSQLPDWLTLTNLDNFTYRLAGAPTEADVGNYDIQLILSDEEGLSDNQNFQISVLPVNDAPEIQQGESLALNVVEDQSISTRLSLFDSDSETFQWQILTPAQFGVVTVDQGLIQYNPNTNSEAPDSFVIELSDGELTDTILVNVSVTAENDAPQILLADGTSPSRSSATSAEDTQLDVRLTAFDTDSSNLTWTLEQQATLGSVTIDQGLLTYQPLPDFVGSDSVRVLLSDGELSDSLTLSITVTSVNDAPVILLDDIVQLSLNEDENIELIYQAQDDNGVENLTWQVTQAPSLGQVSLDANGQGSGDSNSGINSVLNYQANPNSFGQDSFVLQVSDGELTDQVEVRLTLNPVNDSPIGEADEYSVNEAELLSVDLSNGVLTNDTDLDNDDSTLVAELVAQPSRASVFNFSSDGSFSYQHDGSDFGLDSFSYRVFDGVDFSQSIEVNLTILPVNDLPQFISSSPSESVQQGDFFNYDIGTFDPDDINLSLSYQGPDWLVLNGHNLSGVVPIEQTGAVSFTLTLQDASGGENTQTANFSIIERDIIQLDVIPSWSASPAFVDEKVVANIQLQSFSEQAETLQLNLTLSEGVSVIKSADCPFTGVTASCNIQVSLAEIQNIQIELLSAQAQDILLTANLVDQFNVSVGSVSTDVAVVKQAVNQGNASFDISNATAISAADIAENQGVEIIAGTELGDTIKIVTMSAAEEQASLLAEIDNTGQTEQVLIDDFDQNGELDIAIINSQGQSSDIYYWIAPLTYQTNPSTNQINFGTKGFIQDFNFDGLPDLAVTGNSFNLAIYINVDGVFSETPDVYTTDSLIVSALGLGASNEIVVATKTNLQTLSYQISNQQQRPSNITGVSRRSVRTDIVSYASKVEKASFVPISEPLEIVGITDIAVADLDGDSSQDIVVTSRPEKNSNATTPAPVANNSVSIIATNRSKLTKVASFGSSATNKVSIADFDGDNKPDLMVGNDNGTVQIFKRGLANDNSYEAQESAIVASSPLIIPVDIDGDGLSDVISYDKEQGKVALFSTNSDGSLGQQVDIALSSQMTLTEVGFAQDSRIFYQLFVANLSQIPTQQNQVKLTPDEGVDVSQMPAYCQQQDSSDQIVCELGTLANESTKQIPFMLSGEFSNRSLLARYNGAVADPNPDNNSVSNHFSQYSGNLAVKANLLASNNYQFNYQVSATNLHSSTLTNVKTKISFPLGLGYIQVPDNCVRQNSTLDVLFICQFGTLAAQQSADIDFELKSSAELNEQEIMIDVQGKSDVIDTDTSNNAAQTNLKGVFTAPSVSKSSGGSNSYSLLAYLFILFLIRFLIRFNYVACNRYVSTVGESK